MLKACQSHDRDPAEFADLIDAVVEKCVVTGLVNDQAYAETKTASLRRRGGSKRKIEAQLIAKGINRQTIEGVVQDDPEAELEAAFRFARRRRLGPYRSRIGAKRDPQLQRDKDLAAMCRAGFSFDLARQVIDAEVDQISNDYK
ncbi:MAG: RecX family transcriptional regulator [Pseudomonadota bacterium]